jgi:hypothetical protein
MQAVNVLGVCGCGQGGEEDLLHKPALLEHLIQMLHILIAGRKRPCVTRGRLSATQATNSKAATRHPRDEKGVSNWIRAV